MDLLLAQFSTPDVEPSLFKDIVTVLGWAVAIVVGLWAKFGAQRIMQPLTVEAKVEYVTRREFREHQEHVRREQQELKRSIDQRFDDLQDERRLSIENLHKHITSIKDEITGSMRRVEDKIDERLEAGAERMIEHDKAIARLEGSLTKGGHE